MAPGLHMTPVASRRECENGVEGRAIHELYPKGVRDMTDRMFIFSQRLKLFLISLGIVALAAPGASAALKKYSVNRRTLTQYEGVSPSIEYISGNVEPFLGVGLIDESGPEPILQKLIMVTGGGGGRTVLVPSLTNGFIFINSFSGEGPSGGQTGTGSGTADGQSINWGNLSGWTISGGTFCHSVPSYICDYAVAEDLGTVSGAFLSNNYDIGTWTFHGTGFLQPGGYINRTNTTVNDGNSMFFIYGANDNDGTVPALPLLGIGAVGVSVFAMGVASIRRRKE